MNPSIGRIVHYIALRYHAVAVDPIASFIKAEEGVTSSEVVPAIITKVHTNDLVNLRILGGPDFGEEKTSVRLGDGEPNTWIWPPRV